MNISKMRVTCRDCGEVSDADFVSMAPLKLSIASIRAMRCPMCHSRKVILGGAYKDAPAVDASTVRERADWWYARGDVGTSSLTIWCAYMNVPYPIRPRGDRPEGPIDPADFLRCKALFDLIPEWRADFTPLVSKYPWFRPYVDQWERFERLYAEEFASGRATKLYAELQAAGTQARIMKTATDKEQ